MQQFTNASAAPGIQIRESGRMFCLCSEGRVIGFASSFDFAEVRASELGAFFSVSNQISGESSHDKSVDLTFGSRKEFGWVVEVCGVSSSGSIQIATFPTAAEAGRFRDELEAYHRSMPESEAEGEWSEAQIAWFKAHPAAIASAHGGVFRIRYQGVH